MDGKPLATRERTRLFLFHKPRGLVTTDRDPEGRPRFSTISRKKIPDLPRLMSVGRLDINTEGLLLLTNDGGLARVLELPSTGWLRRYRARANGVTDQAKLDTLAKGVTIDGVDYAGVEARLDRVQGANVWITLGLREGKNREVKRLLEHLGPCRQPPDPPLLWAVPAGRNGRGRGRGSAHAGARRPAWRKPRRSRPASISTGRCRPRRRSPSRARCGKRRTAREAPPAERDELRPKAPAEKPSRRD